MSNTASLLVRIELPAEIRPYVKYYAHVLQVKALYLLICLEEIELDYVR